MRYKTTKNFTVSMSTDHSFFFHFQINADLWERIVSAYRKLFPRTK